ncbi:MAG TPA: recombination mediator RecR [Phycisphaerales bacterium]|nr:recombination mediator RecR [Phycisphaerales bacterium]
MADGAATPTGQGGSRPGRTSAYPEPVDRLITELASLPGIGRRSAERIAFHLLKADEPKAMALARAIADTKRAVKHCSICSNLTAADPCPICADPERDRSRVLVVEQPKDLIALEQTGMYKGLYHVLMGRLSPLDGIGPGELTIAELLRRLDNPAKNPGAVKIEEVILGLNPTLEGDGTALYLAEQIRARAVAVTRLARGLPSGAQLEYVSKAVLADAIEGRREMS